MKLAVVLLLLAGVAVSACVMSVQMFKVLTSSFPRWLNLRPDYKPPLGPGSPRKLAIWAGATLAFLIAGVTVAAIWPS